MSLVVTESRKASDVCRAELVSLSHQHCDVTEPMPGESRMTLCHLLFVTLLISPVGQRWWCPVEAGGRAFT